MDFKNTCLAKSTPRGTVWVAVGPDGVHICDVIVLSANRKWFSGHVTSGKIDTIATDECAL